MTSILGKFKLKILPLTGYCHIYKVKHHISETALHWLLNEKQRSKKVRNNEYSDLTIQKYLVSEILNVKQKKFLTHLRGKMVKVRANYSKMYDNIFCPLCISSGENFEDSPDHLLKCKILCNDKDIDTGTEYMNIYSEEPRKFEEITVLLEQKFKLREKIIKNKPSEPSKVFCYANYV